MKKVLLIACLVAFALWIADREGIINLSGIEWPDMRPKNSLLINIPALGEDKKFNLPANCEFTGEWGVRHTTYIEVYYWERATNPPKTTPLQGFNSEGQPEVLVKLVEHRISQGQPEGTGPTLEKTLVKTAR